MDKCVVRKAIKNVKADEIAGYELLFQEDDDSLYNNSEVNAANTIATFLMDNTGKIFKDNQIFITFTPSLLFRNTAKMFDKDKIVIQIEENLIIHPLAAVMIEKHRKDGYRFAINNFQFTPKYFSMLEYMDFIRLDVTGYEERKVKDSMANMIQMAHGFGKACIAYNVDTKEDYEMALSLDADYVEGQYVAEGMVTKMNKVEYLQGNLYQLIIEVTKEEPNLDELESIVSRDAALTYSLLKLANSAYFATRRRTASIHQALVTVGLNQLKQWVYLLSFESTQDMTPGAEEVLKLSFLRANYAARLVNYLRPFPINRSEAYMMGMFSALEYIVDATLEEILQEIPISDVVKDGMIKHEGKAGQLFDLVLAYERADWKVTKSLAGELELETNILAQAYIDCVEEVNSIWESLTDEEDGAKEEAPEES
ncbi:MAG: HDOD domain-containing protein [Lachnospiraceae bacterium]|jgi:EAL and modified HD-GYP domain-containing signal transduction protein|uniref:EAL and HDOD domain-containing protein n=1 Tax=Candidatus Merdisoma sp. JLR.KK006 TaxID=3112626 RepID=UPI002FEE927A|nr:HDOD domain-containing protein [Lachnospiraceae bacterium]